MGLKIRMSYIFVYMNFYRKKIKKQENKKKNKIECYAFCK